MARPSSAAIARLAQRRKRGGSELGWVGSSGGWDFPRPADAVFGVVFGVVLRSGTTGGWEMWKESVR